MTRNLSIDLSPVVLEGEGLSDALEWLASQMHERYRLVVEIQTNGVITRFKDSLGVLLFQAVREVLFNVVKHAEILHATVTLKQNNRAIQIIVSDDGVGFQPDVVELGDGNSGLAHMQRRLRLMTCDLHVESQPGDGTRVIIQVPSQLVIT